jgi:uncharacterized radical SAM superfamily Fe-S cluster-containing enzyme
VVARFHSAMPTGRLLPYTKINEINHRDHAQININSDKNKTQ